MISLVAEPGDNPLFPSHPLQEVQVRVISQEECVERFGGVNIAVTEEIICVDKLHEDDPPTRTCQVRRTNFTNARSASSVTFQLSNVSIIFHFLLNPGRILPAFIEKSKIKNNALNGH